MTNTTSNREARDMELVALYNPALQLMIRRGVKSPRRAALHFAVLHGHPRYHVSFKHAYEKVCQLLRRGKITTNNSLQMQMWAEITGRVANLCQQEGMSVNAALDFVLEHCRASRFFITEEYADTIIDHARRTYRSRKFAHQTA